MEICLNHGASDIARLKSLLPKTRSTIVKANATVKIIVYSIDTNLDMK